MAAEETPQDPELPQDARLGSLDERLRHAQQEEALRTKKAEGDPNYRMAVHAVSDEVVRWATGEPGAAATMNGCTLSPETVALAERIAYTSSMDGRASSIRGDHPGSRRVGEPAAAAMQAWLAVRHEVVPHEAGDVVFANERGRQLTPRDVRRILDALGRGEMGVIRGFIEHLHGHRA